MSKKKRRPNVPDQGTPAHGPTTFETRFVLSPFIPYGESDVEEASWELAPRVEKHTLGWRDRLVVQIYFSGYGIPRWAKLSFHPPLGVLGTTSRSDERPHISVTSSVSMGMPQGIAENAIPRGTRVYAYRDFHTMETSQHGADLKVPIAHFFPLLTSRDSEGSRDLKDAEEDQGHRTVAEVDIKDVTPQGGEIRYPPYIVQARIPFWAAAGDYSIPFVMSYETGGYVKSSSYRLGFHIKSFWEKAWFQAAVLGVAIAAVVIAAAQWFGILHH